MKRTLRSLFLASCLIAALPSLPLTANSQEKEKEQIKGVLAEPADAAEVREQIAVVEKLKPVVPDRGAVLFFLSTAKQHLGETREALALLKECMALREGFDPSGSPSFLGLKGTKEFDDLVAAVRRDFPAVARARLAFVTEGKVADFVPADRYGLLPVLGIRLDPADETVWAATFEDAGRTDLVHFDSAGKLLDRYAPKDNAKRGFNDLVVRKNGEV